MNCPMKSCKNISEHGECTVDTRAKIGNYNCKFENCENYTTKGGVTHSGYKISLIGDSTAELLINPKKFDLLTCYKLSEAFKLKGNMFSPAMIFEELTKDSD